MEVNVSSNQNKESKWTEDELRKMPINDIGLTKEVIKEKDDLREELYKKELLDANRTVYDSNSVNSFPSSITYPKILSKEYVGIVFLLLKIMRKYKFGYTALRFCQKINTVNEAKYSTTYFDILSRFRIESKIWPITMSIKTRQCKEKLFEGVLQKNFTIHNSSWVNFADKEIYVRSGYLEFNFNYMCQFYIDGVVIDREYEQEQYSHLDKHGFRKAIEFIE